jgi:hypothetical protein
MTKDPEIVMRALTTDELTAAMEHFDRERMPAGTPPASGGAGDPVSRAWRAMLVRGGEAAAPPGDEVPALAVIDLRVGEFAVTLPTLSGPTFVRLAHPAGAVVDRARAAFVLTASANLRWVTGGWIEGPGVLVEPAGAAEAHPEIYAVGHGIGVLGSELIARSYLALCGAGTAGDDESE